MTPRGPTTMPDIIDPDSLATQPDPPSRAATGVARPVIIDCRGSAGISADQQGPVLARRSGKPDLLLYPGVQPVEASTWTAYLDHPGLASRVTPIKVKDGTAPDPEIFMVDELPRRVAALTELIARTWSTAGLDMLAAHEQTIRPKVQRADVVKAIADQRRRLARRIKPT